MICALEKPIERLAVLAGREAFVSIVSMKVASWVFHLKILYLESKDKEQQNIITPPIAKIICVKHERAKVFCGIKTFSSFEFRFW